MCGESGTLIEGGTDTSIRVRAAREEQSRVVGSVGFEPTKARGRLIYSQARLTASVTAHGNSVGAGGRI